MEGRNAAIQIQLMMANIYETVGQQFSDRNEHEQALEYYLKCLEIQEKLWGEGHPQADIMCIKIAGEYISLKQDKLAADFLRRKAGIKTT